MKRVMVSALLALFLVGTPGAAFAEGGSETVFRVSGMTCGMCAKAVERALEDVPGVKSVAIDGDSGRVAVTAAGDVEASSLEAAIESAGSYEAELEEAERG